MFENNNCYFLKTEDGHSLSVRLRFITSSSDAVSISSLSVSCVLQHAIIGGTFLRWLSHAFALSFTLKLAPDWSRSHRSWEGSAAASQDVVCYQVR